MWWRQHHGVPDFEGLKLSCSTEAVSRFPDVHLIRVREKMAKLIREPGKVASGSERGGGHSGFQITNLVAQFGVSRIIWVGMDMRIDRGIHWHGRHKGLLNNPREVNVINWRFYLDQAAPQFEEWGIEVLNASSISMLGSYPKVSLAEVFK